MSASEYFNPIPLFILFREAIEASIVVSVLLTFVARSSVPGLKAQSECAVRRFPQTHSGSPLRYLLLETAM